MSSCQELGGARRHVGHEEGPRRLGGALQRQGELLLVDRAQQRLRRGRVELHQVVEGEHQRLDALGAFAVRLLERGEEARLGLAVEGVEDLGDQLVRVAPLRLVEVRHELDAQGLLDPLEHVLLHALHAQHAVDDVEREILGQDRQHAGRLLLPDLGEHHRDGLRVFVLQVVGEHVVVHVGELLPHVAARRPADLLHDLDDTLGRQIGLQQPLGVVEIAHHGARGRHLADEFEHEHLDRVGFERAEMRHGDRDRRGSRRHRGLSRPARRTSRRAAASAWRRARDPSGCGSCPRTSCSGP